MAVHGAESENSSFKESLVSDLGYRAFSWCCLSVLGECLACLLQHRCTSKHPRVGDYKNALQHDQLVNSSWRVVKFDDIVPILQLLILPAIKCGPYHHCVEMFYSEKAISVYSTHRECYGTTHDEDKSCSRSKQPFLSLPESITRNKNYLKITFEKFCKESSNLQEKVFHSKRMFGGGSRGRVEIIPKGTFSVKNGK